jgi:hypothetical protein
VGRINPCDIDVDVVPKRIHVNDDIRGKTQCGKQSQSGAVSRIRCSVFYFPPTYNGGQKKNKGSNGYKRCTKQVAARQFNAGNEKQCCDNEGRNTGSISFFIQEANGGGGTSAGK